MNFPDLPDFLRIPPEVRCAAWKGRKLTTVSRDVTAPRKDEDPATKALRKEMAKAEERKKAERFARLNELKAQKKEPTMKTKSKDKTSKADQVAGLRQQRAATKGPKADRGKKAAAAKARTPARPKAAAGAPKGIRPGSKLEIVVGLLTRKQGCTAKECMELCNWPSISMQQQARAAGISLRQEKDGKVTRYWAS